MKQLFAVAALVLAGLAFTPEENSAHAQWVAPPTGSDIDIRAVVRCQGEEYGFDYALCMVEFYFEAFEGLLEMSDMYWSLFDDCLDYVLESIRRLS